MPVKPYPAAVLQEGGMQSHTVRRITSAHAALSLHSLTTRHLTARPSSSSSGRPVRLVPASDTASQQRYPHADRSQCRLDPASTTSPERSEDMHPPRPRPYLLCPRLALLLRAIIPNLTF